MKAACVFAGFQPVSFKVFVFTAGAVAAALGGMLYTPQNGIITPFKMGADESILIVAAVAVGGRGTLSGAVVGSLTVSYLQSLLTSGVFYGWLPAFLQAPEGAIEPGAMGAMRRGLKLVLGAEGWLLILGLVFIVVPLFMPEGIVGLWRKLLSGRSSGRRRRNRRPNPLRNRPDRWRWAHDHGSQYAAEPAG